MGTRFTHCMLDLCWISVYVFVGGFMGYQPRVNCIYNDQGAWCTNKCVKRSLFGIGARCCSEYPYRTGKCGVKVEHPRKPEPPGGE